MNTKHKLHNCNKCSALKLLMHMLRKGQVRKYNVISLDAVEKQRKTLKHMNKSCNVTKHCKVPAPHDKKKMKYMEISLKVRKTQIIFLPKGMKTAIISLVSNVNMMNYLRRKSVIAVWINGYLNEIITVGM